MSITYEWKWAGEGEPVECDCCQADAPVYEFLAPAATKRTDSANMCELCSSTFTGNSMWYPDHDRNHDVMKAICYVGNAVIAATTGRTRPAQQIPDKPMDAGGGVA